MTLHPEHVCSIMSSRQQHGNDQSFTLSFHTPPSHNLGKGFSSFPVSPSEMSTSALRPEALPFPSKVGRWVTETGNRKHAPSESMREASVTRTEDREQEACGTWTAKCPETPGSAVCGYKAKHYKTQRLQATQLSVHGSAHRDLGRAQLGGHAAPMASTGITSL